MLSGIGIIVFHNMFCISSKPVIDTGYQIPLNRGIGYDEVIKYSKAFLQKGEIPVFPFSEVKSKGVFAQKWHERRI